MTISRTSAALLMPALAGLLACGAALAGTDLMAGLPDPTRPDTQSSAQQLGPPLVLQSTLVSGGRKSAVINGRLTTIGSRIQGAQVLEIGPDTVIVRRNARRFTLQLQKKNIIRMEQETRP
ncbi:MAG: hypothetical protein ACE5ET_01185 [Gammaproteobacteria bacterium]